MTNQQPKPLSRGQRRRLQKIHEEQQRRLSMAPSKREVATYVRNEIARRSLSVRVRSMLARLAQWLNQRVEIRPK
jgi:hypothetical protein